MPGGANLMYAAICDAGSGRAIAQADYHKREKTSRMSSVGTEALAVAARIGAAAGGTTSTRKLEATTTTGELRVYTLVYGRHVHVVATPAGASGAGSAFAAVALLADISARWDHQAAASAAGAATAAGRSAARGPSATAIMMDDVALHQRLVHYASATLGGDPQFAHADRVAAGSGGHSGGHGGGGSGGHGGGGIDVDLGDGSLGWSSASPIGGKIVGKAPSAAIVQGMRDGHEATRQSAAEMRAARADDLVAMLTAKVSELEEARAEMQRHSDELLEELRRSRESHLDLQRMHAASSALSADKHAEQSKKELAEHTHAAEAWAARVMALQEELGSARAELTALHGIANESRARYQAREDELLGQLAALRRDEEAARDAALKEHERGDSLKALLARSRMPSSGSTSQHMELAAARAGIEALEDQVQALRGKLASQAHAARTREQRLSDQLAVLTRERDELRQGKAILEQEAQARWGRRQTRRAASSPARSRSPGRSRSVSPSSSAAPPPASPRARAPPPASPRVHPPPPPPHPASAGLSTRGGGASPLRSARPTAGSGVASSPSPRPGGGGSPRPGGGSPRPGGGSPRASPRAAATAAPRSSPRAGGGGGGSHHLPPRSPAAGVSRSPRDAATVAFDATTQGVTARGAARGVAVSTDIVWTSPRKAPSAAPPVANAVPPRSLERISARSPQPGAPPSSGMAAGRRQVGGHDGGSGRAGPAASAAAATTTTTTTTVRFRFADTTPSPQRHRPSGGGGSGGGGSGGGGSGGGGSGGGGSGGGGSSGGVLRRGDGNGLGRSPAAAGGPGSSRSTGSLPVRKSWSSSSSAAALDHALPSPRAVSAAAAAPTPARSPRQAHYPRHDDPPHPPHQPEVRLAFDGGSYKTPDELHRGLVQPAGVHGVLAIVATGPSESRVACRSWTEAYKLLTYCTSEVQRSLGLRCKPAEIEGVALTRTQMARLAQSEAPPHPHVLRAESARAGTWSTGVAASERGGSPRPAGVPPADINNLA
jgi:hypothetical protein